MATILIVDDLSANRKFLVTLLGHNGHRLVEAANGRDGLAAVQAERPDLVITDVLMPVMDGYEFVRRLRLDPGTSRIPVLFYTAPYGEHEARAFARSSGLPYVLTKPAMPDEVIKIVSRVLAGETESTSADSAASTEEVNRDHLRLLTDQLSENAEELRDTNARLRALINIGLDITSSHGSDRLLESVCNAACDLFGATYVTLGVVDRDSQKVRRFVVCGTDASDWIKPGDRISGVIETVVSRRRIVRGDNAAAHPDGPQFLSPHPEVQAFLAVPIASRAHVYGWICLVGNEGRPFAARDEPMVMALAAKVGRIYELEYEILERKQAESAMRHERDRAQRYLERTRFALEATGVGIWDMNAATGAVQWSEILEAQYGLQPGTFAGTFEAFIGHIHPDDRDSTRDAFRKAIASGADFSVQHRSIRPDGAVRWLSGEGRFQLGEGDAPVRGVGISQDITERRALEEQSLQGLKMEAVGRLAGGVAHDFNNLLTAILGYCELLRADLAPSDPHQSDIEEIHKAGKSAAGLTRQLLAFSRKEIIEPECLDLNLVLGEMQAMLGRLIREDVKIVMALQRGPATVNADRTQIEQIVMNLAVNARDAMPLGGTLIIETADIELDEHYARMHPSVRPGSYVSLTVSDTGTGMTPQVKSHLFEPFFTTKDIGRGTGLGLSTVHGIVTRSGGTVTVYSEVGAGTTFRVYFPRVDDADISHVTPPAAATRRSTGETILIAEDAPELRQLTKRLLEKHGYRVLVAADAIEARKIFERGESIDLLLTDVVMPGDSGPALMQQLVERWPALKVIFMSGYTESTIVHDGVLNPGIAFLHKPFTSEALARKVREVLDRVRPPRDDVEDSGVLRR